MNVLVTGGTGFVGSHVIEVLRAAGDSVRAIIRRNEDAAAVLRYGATPCLADLERPDTLGPACKGIDVVCHAAARVDIVGAYELFHRITVEGTRALVAAAAAEGVRRFVYVSSCGVYHPRQLRAGVIREDTPVDAAPSWFRYARAKLAAEQVVQQRVIPPAEWVILRLGYLYGPRNRAMRQYFHPLLASGWMSLIGRADNPMALLHVRDAARAISRACRVPQATGNVLIASGAEHITQRDYFDAMADGFGLPRVRRRIPYRLAYAIAWVFEHLPISPPLRGTFQRAGIVLTGLPQRIDCAHTRELLGWSPQVRFSEGMREATNWFAREYACPDLTPASDRA